MGGGKAFIKYTFPSASPVLFIAPTVEPDHVGTFTITAILKDNNPNSL